ncbi:Putative O-methyltransferase domain, S-adenosyl-L-methionine-dependent methyltransferase [Septoria linicola]|uniref:O-methyltransferase domain, S-adenosyl-L-methionine-dependent methyltransferase n=1 Tax=Septoria linicola TaxID=215465 RepID=A0A9Q9B9I6_9PEZI|nr:Putative O-methyltransferase domain, S-adenosyl-L-methionine-dependent methyltransferase [Septoria linicola]
MRLQTPFDIHIRFRQQYLVQSACIRIGIDLGIFRTLLESNGSMNTKSLAKRLGAAPDLLRRIMRELAAAHAVDQTGKEDWGEFIANSKTRFYVDPEWEKAICALFNAPTLQDLPGYLVGTKYQTPTSTASPIQKALATKDTFFAHIAKEDKMSDKIALIQKVMSAGSSREWTKAFPIDQELHDWDSHPDPDKVLFVDLGGGMFNGQQCERFKKSFPYLQGRVVLQDQQSVLQKLSPIEGVEFIPQNFFEPQHIQRAKFYYLREVLHDWSDDKCIEILQNLVGAMDTQHSRILIDDQVLPDIGCTWQDAGADISMMMIGGAERSIDEWKELVQRAGLEILRVHSYCKRPSRSVLVVGRT